VILSLLVQGIRKAPRRLFLAAFGVAFPVAMLAATLLFVDTAVLSMTHTALGTVQVEMRALATTLSTDINSVRAQLAAVPGVKGVDRFAATDVVVGTPGAQSRVTARLFAVDAMYIRDHPWVRLVNGTMGGAILDESVLAAPGFANAKAVSIDLLGAGNATPLKLKLPVTGTTDLRQAAETWFAIPTGPVQGDVAVVPRAIIVDYSTFEKSVLPALRQQFGKKTPILDPGLTELPPVSLEAHVAIDHSTYPSDPGSAALWSATLRRVLESTAPPGSIVVADNAQEVLTEAKVDATNAKILFVLLGIPAVLVSAALALATDSALTEANRREEALLRLRGATDGQLTRLAAAQAAVASVLGAAIGVLVAIGTVSLVTGDPVWHALTTGRLIFSCLIAALIGIAAMALRLRRLTRASRRSQVVVQRRLLERGWAPGWLRARLDLFAIIAGVVILLIFVRSGGLKQVPLEGQTLALSFYLLLAPICLWIGGTLLIFRGALSLFVRWARPDRAQPLRSWRRASLVWLGRRPARTAVAVVLGALAVAFGTEVVAFVATYQSAKEADAHAAFGSDLRLTPAVADSLVSLPSLGPSVAATSPVTLIPARAGTDRKTILGIDVASYQQTITMRPDILSGAGVAALTRDPSAILIAKEIATDFEVKPGDQLPLTIFPDDLDKSQNYNFRVAGIFRTFPPTFPTTEMVTSTAAFPAGYLAPPDFYLARVAPGRSSSDVAAQLRSGPVAQTFTVADIGSLVHWGQRSLTALNLNGLSRIESVGAGLIAAVGLAVLGAFLVLERRREFAILLSTGASRSQVLTGPALEGIISVLGALVIGIPVGLGLGVLAVRVLGLFFTLPPPVLTMPIGTLAGLVAFVVGASALAFGAALVAVTRVRAASVLREL
jgi:putative ABC transport system permease protein